MQKIALFIVLFSFVFFETSVQAESTNNQDSNSILIAHGKSGLEYNVVELVKREFQEKDYQVQVCDIQMVHRHDLENLKVVILLSAIEKDNLGKSTRRLMDSVTKQKEADRPVLFISKITGDDWQEKNAEVNAVTAATDIVSAQSIAEKIIARVNIILEEKKEGKP